ncbi:uncharacterized protein LOC129000066 [Macrosteles quadrilineatus]|uniref:uncharacterized protein LOC129000066 n=1 Tax=Macrosteles quadrilineatus TaxID=74068 RepID=UPI0023E26004|nr:uncharacterized protein LOC129000066 [Macrosteles quadrilineatus]
MPQVEHRATLRRNTVTQLQFASHRLSVRQDYSPVIHGGKLSLQYIVDMFTRIEGDRLAFIRREQSKLRAELYMNLHDAIRARAENEGLNVGRQVILPKSFQGSYRNLHSNYLDAMSIVRQQGKPDLFITFTCNSNWEEIKSNLKYEPANMRPDLVVRVFHEKLKDLMKEITDNKIFGTVIANIYTIEFQKRGLPHAHILITLDRDSKLRDSDDIDQLVWAEIPDPVLYPDLHEIVARNMIHGPCGTTNPNAPCMIEGKCSKSFPKQFLDQTRENVNGYPIYRRRDDGKTLIVRGSTVDNRFVVPYNPYLLKKFNAHINVEICSTVKSVKYIYKYIYKGFDSASIEFRNGDTIIYDEVQGYLNARWVGSAEAMWRIQEYPMHHQSHTVVNLECHLEDQQRVIFVQGNEEQALEPRNTKLMAWFRLNETDESAREYTYCEIPKHNTWQDNGKFWRKRQRGNDRIIARLNVVSAKNVELFHIRLLLLHVKGARCFNDIRTVDGHVYETYRDAAIARGIAESSQLSRDTLQEAVYYASPNDLRNLFGCLLGLNVPTESLDLWNEFKAYMIEDFTNRGSSEEEALNGALSQIEEILRTHNTSCRDLGLPTPVIRLNQVVNQANSETKRVEFDSLYSKANEDQKKIIDSIIEKVQSRDRCHSLFYLDAPAGCGKTYIQKTLLAKLGSMEMVAIPVAFTGKIVV